ncbi:DUF1829 domain-containing protein [Thermoanaerobacterium thermosaccharolyticum]|uniref:DUF1829 domain-containing protein n=1 Tax=Thermoanaerobacterium thermosaccharolyticum TaxID=1517 RepID=UPI003D2A1FFB
MSFSPDKMVNDYLKWLKENISYEVINDYVEIVTPFLDRHNDSIQIYIKKIDNDNYLLTDGGEIISDLWLSGIDITKHREKIIVDILRRYGAQLTDDNEITINACERDFPLKKHFLIQAILTIDDLFMTSRTNIVSLFTEEVELYLKKQEVSYVSNIALVGKSGFTHNFDFVIPATQRKNERFMKAINRPNKENTTSTIFSWNDVAITRNKDTKLLVILNDLEVKVNNDIINAYKHYDILTIPWSKKDDYKDELTA